MNLDLEFLSILRCPESGAKLVEASKKQLTSINAKIQNGSVHTRGGQVLTTALESALVTVDGQRMFQMIGDIPNLVIDDAIQLTDDDA